MGSDTTIALEANEAKSAGMQRVLDLIRRVAKVDSSVVFEGERGSGKERLARLVHGASARAAAPFVSVGCANVPERLLESELFGHARGAFPGASGERAGLFEAAKGGTLLIEDVTEDAVGAPGEAGPRLSSTTARCGAWARSRAGRSTCASSRRPRASSPTR